MTRKILISILYLSLFFGSCRGSSTTTINLEGQIKSGDTITLFIRQLLENSPKKDVVFQFPKGKYYFTPEGMYTMEHKITNHENGDKNIAFNLSGYKNVEIRGGGSEFIFSGPILPFLIMDTEGAIVSDCTLDWDIPFFLQGEIVGSNPKKGYWDVELETDGYDFSFDGGDIKFPNQYGFVYEYIGESLVFDKLNRSPIYEANKYDMHRRSSPKIELLDENTFRITEKLKAYPPVGEMVTFKGAHGENRYAPAFHAIGSVNVEVRNVDVHHALGMGFIAEKCDGVVLDDFNTCLREGSGRLLSVTADATHFCNCRGDVVLENCLFENMLDDGTNVHGTYMKIDSIMSTHTLRASFGHFQQAGFNFAGKGDQIWLIIAPQPDRTSVVEVEKYVALSDTEVEITFKNVLPKGLKGGDLLENKSWNTDNFIMRNCVVRNHRARNIVLKTAGGALIEGNKFHSMMASILLRAESFFWYESGANNNVVIRNNEFSNCTYGGGNQGVLFISPRLGKQFNDTTAVDRDITFENNIIDTFDNKVVQAFRVENLIVRGNKITINRDLKPFNPNTPIIFVKDCINPLIENNVIEGSEAQSISIN